VFLQNAVWPYLRNLSALTTFSMRHAHSMQVLRELPGGGLRGNLAFTA
jgi:hypothetical protein